MESSLFWLLLRGLWKTLQNPPKLRKSASTQRGLGLDHRMLVDGMREDARGITATFHCLQGHREKAEADSSWGCTMKGQEAKATSFSNGNPNWILGIWFFFLPSQCLHTGTGAQQGMSRIADPADFPRILIYLWVWSCFEQEFAGWTSRGHFQTQLLPGSVILTVYNLSWGKGDPLWNEKWHWRSSECSGF